MHNCQIECAATKVEYQQLFVTGQCRKRQTLLTQHMTQRRSHRLVDHLDPLQPGLVSRQHGRLPLRFAELSRHCDDSLANLTKLFASRCQQLSQYQC